MKNIIIVVLLIGLLISGYFNFRDFYKIKINVGTGLLNTTFYGTNDILTSSGGRPNYNFIFSTETQVCIGSDGLISSTPCDGVIDNTHRGPVTHPTLDSILSNLLKYKSVQIGMKFNSPHADKK
jgi:hypothetical protein